MSKGQRIVVVGGGILGASIAWHLTQAGAAVTLLAGERAGVATPTSFAWINASWGNPEPYFRLRTHAMREWNRLSGQLPGLPLRWCGSLIWDLPREELDAFARQHGDWGYGLRPVTADESLRIEPTIRNAPAFAYHVAEEGAVEPAVAADLLISDAQARGLTVIERVLVDAVEHKAGKVAGVRTSQGFVSADQVVLACGTGVPALAEPLGVNVPIETPPGLIVHSKPVSKILNGLVLAPELHIRQTLEGRIIAGSDFAGTDPGEHPQKAADELFAKVRAFLKGVDRLEMDFFTVGRRPTPVDGFPIVGHAPGVEGLYLAVTHSGVTLAPALGAIAVQEMLEGARHDLLAPYRPERFNR